MFTGTHRLCGGSVYEEQRSRLVAKIEKAEAKVAQRRQSVLPHSREFTYQLLQVAAAGNGSVEGRGSLRAEPHERAASLGRHSGRKEFFVTAHARPKRKGKAAGGVNRLLNRALQVPWFPTGEGTATKNPFPERLGSKRDHPHVDETFHPRINAASSVLLEKGQSKGQTFLDRYQNDLSSRVYKQQVNATHLIGSPEG